MSSQFTELSQDIHQESFSNQYIRLRSDLLA